MKNERAVFACALSFAIASCASPPPPPPVSESPLFIDGVRQKPLEIHEVKTALGEKLPRVEDCYRRERVNTSVLSRYVVSIEIPTDASPTFVQLKKATIPGQVILEDCLLEVFKSLTFPAHVGKVLRVEFPVGADQS